MIPLAAGRLHQNDKGTMARLHGEKTVQPHRWADAGGFREDELPFPVRSRMGTDSHGRPGTALGGDAFARVVQPHADAGVDPVSGSIFPG